MAPPALGVGAPASLAGEVERHMLAAELHELEELSRGRAADDLDVPVMLDGELNVLLQQRGARGLDLETRSVGEEFFDVCGCGHADECTSSCVDSICGNIVADGALLLRGRPVVTGQAVPAFALAERALATLKNATHRWRQHGWPYSP